ncbi:MAG: hypothetical protein AAGJ52_13640, partial [Pseudomonadota bacterium]
GDDGTLIPSGTTEPLFDVFVASRDFAVAAGEDIVLLWDGNQWSPLLTSDTDTPYTGTWISPEEDVVLFESLGQFNVICPYLPGESTQPFCRAYSQPMLNTCGNSNDIKLLMASGDIINVDNFLGDLTAQPIHDETVPLFLTAIWAPEYACLAGPIEPLELFAIRGGDEFWRFDGEEWSSMNVNIPGDQTLTWLSGTSSNLIVATGFKPNGSGGNDGVIWIYDGQNWTEDTDLPAGTPGLTDIVVNSGPFPDEVFADRFASSNRISTVAPPQFDILALAEEGERLFTAELFPSISSDISLDKRLLTPEPIRQGDRITFQIVIFNAGPEPVADIEVFDSFTAPITPISNTCGFSFEREIENFTYYTATVPSLGVNESLICEFQFDVVGSSADTITNQASAIVKDDFTYSNNSDGVFGLEIQAP